MDIKLYRFKKKVNSTKRPSDSGRTFPCTLVEDTSLISPSIRLKAPSDLIGQVKEPVTPGALVTISDEDALLQEPLPTLQLGVLYDGTQKSNLSFWKTGKNLCGGEFLLENAKTHLPDGITDLIDNTFTFSINTAAVVDVGGFNGSLYNKFKENTEYTIYISFSKSGTNGTTNIRAYYSDGTYSAISLSAVTPGEKNIIIFTTPANKTFAGLRKYSGYGTTTLYYDECGIFEGTLTSEDFEAFTGVKTTVNFPSSIYGGYYNADTGILSVTKDSTGADLPTPYQMYQCTPHDVYLNVDVTNIWCDTGAVESCYYWKYEEGVGRMYKFNYAYIPDMDRYYWIKDCRYELGTWVLDLGIDVLASWKNTIGASSHYIERCAYTHDGTIIDAYYPEKTDPELVIIEPEKISNVTPTIFGTTISPSFIVGIIGGMASENASIIGQVYNGSVVYYSLDQDQLGDLVSLLLDSVDLYQIPTSEISQELQKQLINPIQYIHSIKCVPFKPNTSGQEPSGYVAHAFLCGFQEVEIPNGDHWDICKAPTIGDITKDNGYLEKRTVLLKLPLHSDYGTRGKWVLGSPVSKYVFDVTPFGQFEIPSGEILHATITQPLEGDPYIQMEVTTVFDISTGDCTLFLNWGGTSKPEEAFFKVTKNCAIPVPVHQATQDAMSFRQDMRTLNFQAIEAGFNIVKGSVNAVGPGGTVSESTGGNYTKSGNYDISGPVGSAVNSIDKMLKTVDDASRANQVQISGNGNEGSYMSFNKDLTVPRVRCYFTPLAEEDNEERGRPLCQVKRISTIPGYILCSGAEIATYGTAEENNAISQFLNGGFYYE